MIAISRLVKDVVPTPGCSVIGEVDHSPWEAETRVGASVHKKVSYVASVPGGLRY